MDLERHDITMEMLINEKWSTVRLGKAVFEPLTSNDGGYVGIDDDPAIKL
jgi:CHASE2 domain-containing sensor protein